MIFLMIRKQFDPNEKQKWTQGYHFVQKVKINLSLNDSALMCVIVLLRKGNREYINDAFDNKHFSSSG